MRQSVSRTMRSNVPILSSIMLLDRVSGLHAYDFTADARKHALRVNIRSFVRIIKLYARVTVQQVSSLPSVARGAIFNSTLPQYRHNRV